MKDIKGLTKCMVSFSIKAFVKNRRVVTKGTTEIQLKCLRR